MFAEGGLEISSALIIATLVGAGGVIAVLFKLLIGSKDAELEAERKRAALELAEKERQRLELESVKKSYQEIAAEALKSATETANYYRNKEGKPPIIPPAAVVPESHSPSTAAQREAALIATMRASMAQVKVATGQEPRPTPAHAVEPANPASTPDPTPPPVTLLEAMAIKEQIAQVPERTAEKVVEKIEGHRNIEGDKP